MSGSGVEETHEEDWEEVEDRDVFQVQLYCIKELPEDLRLLANPYQDREERDRLRDLGVIFYRDEDNAHGAIWYNVTEPIEAHYYHMGS